MIDIYSDGEHQALVESVALEDLALGPSTAKPKAASAIRNGLSLIEEDSTIKPCGLFQFFQYFSILHLFQLDSSRFQ